MTNAIHPLDHPEYSSNSGYDAGELYVYGSWRMFRLQVDDLPEQPAVSALDVLAGRTVIARSVDGMLRPETISRADIDGIDVRAYVVR